MFRDVNDNVFETNVNISYWLDTVGLAELVPLSNKSTISRTTIRILMVFNFTKG